ncbi:hypothetical protein UFOVP909_130 [uncultured Caudovirales phage]|uniref:Uncharacterized protein n=1 Tax=uncultured Caudovirales phage TaxID=2100421 RepID=A0A6J5QI98_9CAUD|nr:hypothetical protein UFOVP909_130 [uncultured Caudovirales phage]CAB4182106.1 hypothetical protein UFOVP1066_141 [uncultured Caudovirales phage]CAB4198653.1 hypothetical protein UFOVP1315_196 [uncultured Caudovirales phage]CAB4211550.1 hypothetical protein UFOVP1421_157 [uncultured Caudovirales phage]CAB5238663.1 hypothetical protein UFOVP1525_167 [uncultured Caudovirales phage]
MYTIPFDSETLRSIITGDIKSPEIDYTNSKIKGKNFITYLSNLKYESLNINMSMVSFEEKSELICEFIKHNSSCHINQLEATVIKCLFYFRGYDLSLVDKSEDDKACLEQCILSNDEVQQFVEHNKDLIKQLSEILDGVLLYAIKNLTAYKEELGDFITNNIVTEKQDIGKTFVNLFDNVTFNCHYYSSVPSFDNIKYFDHYFDRPIYSGKTLINFITSPQCFIFPLLRIMLEKPLTAEQFQSIYEETHVTSL